MNMEANSQDGNGELIYWYVPEYDKHERSTFWYAAYGVVSFAMLAYAFFHDNFLFCVIVIIAAIIMVLMDGNEPVNVKISITEEGLIIGSRFYDYDELKDFSIVYKPKIGVKKLYFEFKNPIKPRLSIPLFSMNPLIIRGILLKYLIEDLERTDQPLSEGLAWLLKL